MFKCSCRRMKCDKGSDAWNNLRISRVHVFLKNLGQHVPRKINMEFAKVRRKKKIFLAKMAFSRWKNLEQPSYIYMFVILFHVDEWYNMWIDAQKKSAKVQSKSSSLGVVMSEVLVEVLSGSIGKTWRFISDTRYPQPARCVQPFVSTSSRLRGSISGVSLWPSLAPWPMRDPAMLPVQEKHAAIDQCWSSNVTNRKYSYDLLWLAGSISLAFSII